MSLQEVTWQAKLYQKGEEVYPFIPELVYDDAMTTQLAAVTITASAANETVNIPISRLGTTLKIFELYVSPDDVSKITVKINSSSKAYSVSPVQIFSENISAITASNSSTAEVKLYWRATYT